MFDYKLGVSFTAIAPQVTMQNLTLLENSGIDTFEFRPEIFEGDSGGSIRAAAKKMLEKTGKQFVSCHIPFDDIDNVSTTIEELRLCAVVRLRKQLDEAYFFGSRIIVLHPGTEILESGSRQVHRQQLRRSLSELQDSLAVRNLKLALEWLPRMCLGNSLDELRSLLKGFDREIFGFCLDVNHLMDAYRRLPEIVEAIGSDLITLHLSDYDGIDEKHWLPGRGVIDWKTFLAALRKIRYHGPFNYECMLDGIDEQERIACLERNFNTFMQKI